MGQQVTVIFEKHREILDCDLEISFDLEADSTSFRKVALELAKALSEESFLAHWENKIEDIKRILEELWLEEQSKLEKGEPIHMTHDESSK